MPDDQVSHCMNSSCATVFTTFRRRHHCRLCGNIFCSRCCSNLMLIENLYKDVQRVCNICFNRVTKRKRRITHRTGSFAKDSSASPTAAPARSDGQLLPGQSQSHSPSSGLLSSPTREGGEQRRAVSARSVPQQTGPGGRHWRIKSNSKGTAAYRSLAELTADDEPPLPRRKLAVSNPEAPASGERQNSLSQSLPGPPAVSRRQVTPVRDSYSDGAAAAAAADCTSPYAITTVDQVGYAPNSRENYGLEEVQSCYTGEGDRAAIEQMVTSDASVGSREERSSFVCEPVSEYRGQNKAWNAVFQETMRLQGDEKYEGLTRLADDFASTAITYAKVIISELCFPEDQKTIQTSTNLGGTAGGAKYVVQGIMFKIALDTMISETSGLWMYGGSHCEDGYAMKAAAKELLGLSWCYNAVSDAEIEGLHFPLMAVIDYKGFRVIAVSVLPLNAGTLRYGSDDGGVTVFASIPDLNEKMEAMGKYLKLKPHKVGLSMPKTIYGPGDIEGHLGEDGLFYVVDFARVMPPEAPSTDEEHPSKPRCVFYQFLRPEYVACLQQQQLCSDAFTGWDLNSESPETNSEEVRRATEHVYRVLVPKFAKKLVAEISNLSPEALANPEELVELLSGRALHPRGLNMRHLGRVRKQVEDGLTRELILSVAVGRTLKHFVNGKMRRKMREIQVPAEEPFKKVVLDFLNKVVSKERKYDRFWKVEVKATLTSSFPCILDEEERREDFDLRTVLNMQLVIVQVLTSVHVKLRGRTMQDLRKVDLRDGDDCFCFVPGDITELQVGVKQLPIISWCAAMDARAKARSFANTNCRKRELKRLYTTACEWFEKTTYQHPYSPHVSLHCGKAFLDLARLTSKPARQDALFSKAYKQFSVTYKDSGVPYGASLMAWADALKEHAQLALARGDKELYDSLTSESQEVEMQLQYEMVKSTDLSKLI